MSCSDRSTQALPILKAAWDRGVTTWDTANAYSNGESERIIAKAIKKVRFLVRTTWPSLTNVSHQYNIPRHRLTILTKCFNPVPDTLETNMHDPTLKTNRDYVWPLPPGEMCRG
jgi:diketogulonate reductase-like aldo/keto reductase